MKDILKYANFGDKFVCRNGDIALYLWMNNKEGYSLQLENEKIRSIMMLMDIGIHNLIRKILMISFQRLKIIRFLRMC